MCSPSAGPVPDKANARRTTVDGLSVAWANTMGSSIADAAFDTFCRRWVEGAESSHSETSYGKLDGATKPGPTCSTMDMMLGSHCAMTIPKSNLCWSRHIRTTNDERSLTDGASTTVLAATSSSCFRISYAVPPAPPVCNMRKRDDILLRNRCHAVQRSYVFPPIRKSVEAKRPAPIQIVTQWRCAFLHCLAWKRVVVVRRSGSCIYPAYFKLINAVSLGVGSVSIEGWPLSVASECFPAIPATASGSDIPATVPSHGEQH